MLIKKACTGFLGQFLGTDESEKSIHPLGYFKAKRENAPNMSKQKMSNFLVVIENRTKEVIRGVLIKKYRENVQNLH